MENIANLSARLFTAVQNQTRTLLMKLKGRAPIHEVVRK